MSERTELWVDAAPHACRVPVALDDLLMGKMMPSGDLALCVASTALDPERGASQVNRALRRWGRRLDAVVVDSTTSDLSDGQPTARGVAAHWRAGWTEVADRVHGPVSALASRLNPQLGTWSADDPGQFDAHRNDRQAAWVRALAGRETSNTTHVVSSRWGLQSSSLLAWWMTLPQGVERAVGFVWTPDEPQVVARIEWAGTHPHVAAHGTWWVGSPSRSWPQDAASLDRLRALWHPDVGDRESRIAFVGADLPISELDQSFERCIMPASQRRMWSESAMTPDPFRGRP